ncbi:MAG: hypothetical protein KY469_19715 [Actinobacteria bacterium]|nr:hypothetical protein [Actinomycetota bacterium]
MRTLVSARSAIIVLVLGLAVALTPLLGGTPTAFSGPVADSDEAYLLCGRIFPDPQAYWAPEVGEDTPHPGTGTSPYAKGNAPCAARTFITFEEALRGLTYMADANETTKDYVDLIDLTTSEDPRIREVLDEELGDGWSEGIPNELGEREKVPMYLVKVTAPEGEQLVEGVPIVPEAERDHFVWALSMHGIERAGIEGGLRAAEDLATWAKEDPNRPILETAGETITTRDGLEARNIPVGEVMMRSVSYFVLMNPDGWRRGDPEAANTSFMRYNGNGMDLNRDWPELGHMEPGYSAFSESESRSVGKVLQNLSDNWTGGIDLHGMVVANAFSYTLIGGSQRPYGKNERVMQFVEQAWADAEERLAWSPQIKPNSAPEQCVEFAGVAPNGDTHLPPEEECDQRAYGVQYGTIWDTIEYTVTGAMGNWIDSPVGLNADGIDNEMMLSHLGNCGTGTCFLPEAEQLHVDGNKSLIYAMLNFSIQPPPAEFEVGGDVGYLVNPRRLVDHGYEAPTAPEGAVDADDVSGTANHTGSQTVLHSWEVDNASGETFIAGMSGSVRWSNVAAESAGDVNSIDIEYFDSARGEWIDRPTYRGGILYRTPGAHSDWNYPEDGEYRLVVNGQARTQVFWELELSTEPVWDQPIQAPYDATNMDFFAELEPFLGANTTLTALDVDEVLSGERSLSDFDTVIAIDDALLPGYNGNRPAAMGVDDLPPTHYGPADAAAIGQRLNDFATAGGNVVLTDDAIRGAAWMGLVEDGDVRSRNVYAGHASFNTPDGYEDPLAAGLDQPGSAEGVNGRRQTVEPVPLGYPVGGNLPEWNLRASAVTGVGGRVVAYESGNSDRAAVAEIPVGEGVVRTFGSALPFPTTQYYHPLGLASYSITDNGYTLLKNLLAWENASQSATPDLTDADITWVESDTPNRVYVDGTNFRDEGPWLNAGTGAGAATASAVRLTAVQRELLIR